MSVTTVSDALAQARGRIPPGEARLLLRHVLACSAADIAAHPERTLQESQSSRYADLVVRRAAGEPIAYLVGSREFHGREFRVTPAVLIPRPETELLVEVAMSKVSRGGTPRILDLGAGSGCVAITLALELGCAVIAVDVSADALTVAKENAERLGANVRFVPSDWFAGVEGRFDLIVGNPPYVAEGNPHLSEGDLRFEPSRALSSGADGLDAISRIVAGAPGRLKPRGWLFLEHGYDQADAVRLLLIEAGFEAVEQHRDLAGIIRVTGGMLTRNNARVKCSTLFQPQ
jgi:release factor glutamine methyltransferase